MSETTRRITEIILIPGLLEPRFVMLPLRSCLSTKCNEVEIWRDRLAFRKLDSSVDRLATRIAGDPGDDQAIGIVTHSFGDWVARAALAKQKTHRVGALVSIAPVMRAGFLPTLAYLLTGNLIPEIAVILDRNQASANIDCDPNLRRMVVWSKFDESLRRVDLAKYKNIQTRDVAATHLTIVLQRNVHRLVNDCLFEPVDRL